MNPKFFQDRLDISRFAHSLDSCSSLSDLQDHLREFTELSGFRWYTLHDIAMLSNESLRAIRITNYPKALWEQYDRSGFARCDPILKALEYTGRVLWWRDIPDTIVMSKKQAHVLSEADRAGIKEGVSAPVRLPGHYHGLMTLISDQRVEYPVHRRAYLSFIAPIAYEVAARLHPRHLARSSTVEIELSPRQMECLILVARGKSDWEAAQILGLSEQTVHRHVELIRQKLGVRRRTQLVVKALHLGLISYQEVI